MKKFNEFINEGARDLMKPKSEEEVKKSLEGLSSDEILYKGLQNKILWLIKYALEEGANPNMSYNDTVPLLSAVHNNNKEMTELLIEYGADIEEYENDTYYNDEYIFPEALSLFTITNKKRRMD